ncbi:hypothetical protein CASFOL_002656 [Castilleja foliolosa]|uniref:Uncharacterized protein n=1 Tax=Castilleja foliolosa TaxID=1961234 RepID=A0ABD3EIN3_9LAMI
MGGFAKKLKVGKLVGKLTNCLSKLCSAGGDGGGLKDEELAFTTFIIKVNTSKPGWQKGIIKLLKNCKGARFKMDGGGVVEVSGISRPMNLMKKIGKSGKAELQWIQYGQCCANLFMPAQPAAKDTKKDPPIQHNYNHNPNPALLPYNNNNYGYNHNYDHNHNLSLSLPPSSYYYGGGDYGYYAPPPPPRYY